MEKKIRALRGKVGRILEWVLFFIFISLVGVVTIQIIARFFPIPLLSNQMFSGELTGYLLVYLTLLGMSFATLRCEHMSISYFVEKLPVKSQLFFRHLGNLIYFGVGIILSIVSVQTASFSFMLGTMGDTIPIPVGVIYLVFPISFILMSFFVLLQSVLLVIDPRGELEKDYRG